MDLLLGNPKLHIRPPINLGGWTYFLSQNGFINPLNTLSDGDNPLKPLYHLHPIPSSLQLDRNLAFEGELGADDFLDSEGVFWVLFFLEMGGAGDVDSLNSSMYGLVSDPRSEDGEEVRFILMVLRR